MSFENLPLELLEFILSHLDHVMVIMIAMINKNFYKITLKYCQKNGYYKLFSQNLIACKGYLNILIEAHQNKFKTLKNDDYTKDICINAAYSGHLHILQWAYENGYKIDSSISFYARMDTSGKIAKWLDKIGLKRE